MSRKLTAIEQVWIASLKSAREDLIKRGDLQNARIANRIADAMEKGEPVDMDTFRQPEEAG